MSDKRWTGLVIFAVVIALVLAMTGAFNDGTTQTVALPVPGGPGQIAGHDCDPDHYFMQCALRDQEPPTQKPGLLLTAPFGVTNGIDFAWGGPSCSTIRTLGYHFAASYWSHDVSKNWTSGAVGEYHAHGCGTVGTWESTATRTTEGFSAGQDDAHEAIHQAAAVGNTRDAVLAAIDCDCSITQIRSYFQGWHSVLGARGDAYGGYYQLTALCTAGLVGHQNWQTYAWSAGHWASASCAPLEQWSNDHSVAGKDVDLDRAILPNYGQWPVATPLDPLRYLIKTPFHFGHTTASEYLTVLTWVHARCSAPARRPTCKSSYFHATLLYKRDVFVATHHLVRGHWVAIHGRPRYSYPNKQHPLGSRIARLRRIVVFRGHNPCPTVQSCMP